MSHGFVQISEMYLEDDIPHIDMKGSSYILVIKLNSLSNSSPFPKGIYFQHPIGHS
jgi:hypothetical protein